MKADKRVSFKKLNNEIKKTSVIPYIKSNGLKKDNNCENCDIFCGASVDCYNCLLAKPEARDELDKILKDNKLSDIYNYEDVLRKNAKKYNDATAKRMADIIESAMYLKLL